jgi:ADP-ribose pyrophosphatase YjhB (NUDIX family)
VRTAGIWIVEEHILLEALLDAQVWGIPDGALEPDESVFDGYLREYREELGTEMQVGGMALINENFYTDAYGPVRENCFYCLMQSQSAELHTRRLIASLELQLTFRWFHLDEVPSLTFVPPFLKTLLPQLSAQTMFLSTRE